MPKKYLKAENIELLDDFGLKCIYMIINYRCHRIICGGNVLDVDNSPKKGFCSCEKCERASQWSFDTGENSVKKKTDVILHITDEKGNIIFYYDELCAFVDSGIVQFYVKQNPILTLFPDGNFDMSRYKLNLIKIDVLKSAISASGISIPLLQIALEDASLLNYYSADKLETIISSMKNGYEVLYDVDFVKKHSFILSEMLDRTYRFSGSEYKSAEDIAEKYGIPKCLSKYIDNLHYKKFIDGHNYDDILKLDEYSNTVKNMFSMYVACSKISKADIWNFIRYFDPRELVSDDVAKAFVNFVKKNIYMGDALFSVGHRVYEYLKTHSIPITDDTFNWKYFCVSTGINYSPYSGDSRTRAMIEDFSYIRETQGIIAAMKRLSQNLAVISED
jgi:hypothetical protein